MLVLFRMKYVLVAFVIGWFCGMWAAFSEKGCGEPGLTPSQRQMTSVPLPYAPAMPPGPPVQPQR